MYNVYEKTYYYRIDGGIWFEKLSSVWEDNYCLIESNEDVFEEVKWQDLSWDMLNASLKNYPLRGIVRGKTFISKRPYIRFYDTRGEHYDNYFDDDKHQFSIKVAYTKLTPSIEWLTENLTADEFIKYFTSRGMMVCPIT